MLSTRGLYLKNLVENQGSERAAEIIGELLTPDENGRRRLRPEQVSIREIAEGTMGEQWIAAVDRAHSNQGGLQLLESNPAAVDSTAFSNITGQIVYNKIKEGFEAPEFIGDSLVTKIPTQFHDGEKIAGITEPLGQADDVEEGMEFPEMSMKEDYIQTPSTIKTGNIIGITKEAVAKDRTGVILERAKKVGQRIALRRECRILDVVLGITNNHKWLGTTYNTYLTAGGWINDKASLPLVDWTSIDDVMVQLSEIVNPFQTDANEPLPVMVKDLLVMPSKQMTAKRILGATEVRAVSNTDNTTLSANPIGNLALFVSALAYQRLVLSGISTTNAKQYWFAGDAKRAFGYMEVYPLQIMQAPVDSEAAFRRDIVAQFKGVERGVPVVLEPRAFARRYNA